MYINFAHGILNITKIKVNKVQSQSSPLNSSLLTLYITH